jgi:hypothetical protein
MVLPVERATDDHSGVGGSNCWLGRQYWYSDSSAWLVQLLFCHACALLKGFMVARRWKLDVKRHCDAVLSISEPEHLLFRLVSGLAGLVSLAELSGGGIANRGP